MRLDRLHYITMIHPQSTTSMRSSATVLRMVPECKSKLITAVHFTMQCRFSLTKHEGSHGGFPCRSRSCLHRRRVQLYPPELRPLCFLGHLYSSWIPSTASNSCRLHLWSSCHHYNCSLCPLLKKIHCCCCYHLL